MEFTACCQDCEKDWTEDEQEAETGDPEPTGICIYCGSSDVVIEES